MQRLLILSLMALPLLGCGGGSETPPGGDPPGGDPPPAEEGDALEIMKARIAEVSARSDVPDDVVEVEHILIAFNGALRMGPPKVTRTTEEAELLAAELYVQIARGADFTELKGEHSDDNPSPGIYEMSQNPAVSAAYRRSGMVPAFGDVGWKLAVGEVGVAPFDQTASPFGWHIIKRLR